jgi:hypothetical protein
MPISYAERKKRRQALLQGLVPELRQRLALRHVEAVARLHQEAQRTLAEALSAGLGGIPEAIATLHEHPRASIEEVLQAGKDGRQKGSLPPSPGAGSPGSPGDHDSEALAELSSLLQDCFPGMPGMTAEALAADELLTETLALVRGGQACLRSKSIQSELVFVVLCGLVLRWIEELNQLMVSRPHYRGALKQSGLSVKWLDSLLVK